MDESSIELEVGWWKKPSPFTPTGAWQALDEEFPGDYSAQPKTTIMNAKGFTLMACYYQPCENSYLALEPVHPEAKFVCRNHIPQAPNSARFQATQFDKALKGSKKK